MAERSQTERRQQPEDLRRPPPPAALRARDEARGIAGLGEPRRAEPQPLCAERGFVCGSRRGRRADKGAEPERRVTAGHARPPPQKGPAPEAAMAGGRGSGPYSPGAAERSPKAAESSQPGRAAVPGSSAPAAGRHEPGTPLPEPLTVPRGPLLLPGFDIFRRSACLRRARPCAAPRLRAPRRRLPPPAGAMRSLLPSEAASRPQQGGSVRTGASGSTALGTRAALAAPRWPSPVPAQGSPDGTGRSGAPSHPHARTCRQPSDIPPAVAAPGERGGGGAGLLLPSDGVVEPRDRPPPPPPPSEGKSNVLLSKASSTLQNIPPRFCRGRGLPAPRPAKQAGSGSALRSAMAGTGRHRAGGAPAAAQRPPPTAAPRPLGAPPAAPGASPRRPPPRAALRSDGGAAPRPGPPQMDTEPSRCWGLCRGSRGARGQLLNNGRVWS